MAQTDLKSDSFCLYNQSAAPLEWTLQKASQQGYENTFAWGDVGVFPAGGTGGSYVRPSAINISSYLSGRDNILSRCNPPLPALDDADPGPITYQNDNTQKLLPMYTREKKAGNNLGAITYIPLTFNFPIVNPQDVNHIIFDGWATRGGASTQQVAKQSWNTKICENFMDKDRFCGKQCSDVNGGYGRQTFPQGEAKWGETKPLRTTESKYFPASITSHLVTSVGGTPAGNQWAVPMQPTGIGAKPQNRHLPSRADPIESPPRVNGFPTQPGTQILYPS